MGSMTGRELATRTGVTPKHISCVLAGTARITIDFALALERALGIGARVFIDAQAKRDLAAARRHFKQKRRNS
jgi:addiction module HigA family antidote